MIQLIKIAEYLNYNRKHLDSDLFKRKEVTEDELLMLITLNNETLTSQQIKVTKGLRVRISALPLFIKRYL